MPVKSSKGLMSRIRGWRPSEKASSIAGAAIAVVLLAAVLLWQRCGINGCPDIEELRGYVPDEASVVMDRDGEEVAKLFQVQRVLVEVDSLPEYVPLAFVAIEDRRFFDHGGVDVRRIPGAMLANLKAGGFEEGFSTITMQLARNVFPDALPASKQTIWRKLGEMRVAGQIEDAYSKEEILQLYLNQIYFGNGAWGIESAAQEYFGRPASELTVAQAAMLAGVPKAPSNLNPRANREAAIERRNLVLETMREQGHISEEVAAEARESDVELSRSQADREGGAPYFVEAVRQSLEERFGNQLYTEGFTIHTTLDLDVQRIAERELRQQIEAVESGRYGVFRHPAYSQGADTLSAGGRSPYLQGAVVIMDTRSGDVLSLIGGRDFNESQFNRAINAERQPGSAFKPFVYATALARGYAPTYPLEDTPIRRVLSDGRVWTPGNYGGSYSGRVTLREALVNSKNVATVRLSEQVGVDGVTRTAESMGLGDLPEVPSVVLGAAEVNLLEMVAAYSAFASLGERAEPRFVSRIEDRNGRVLWRNQTSARQVVDPAVAFLVTNILQDVVNRGTATAVRSAGFRGTVAGKTGTTNDAADVWFMGYTPQIVGGVWLGFDERQTIVNGATGGGIAAPVWGRIMRETRFGDEDWTAPPGVETHQVDETGTVVSEYCPPVGAVHTEYFLTGTVPVTQCYSGPEDYMAWSDSAYGGERREDEGWWDNMRRRLFGDEEREDDARRRAERRAERMDSLRGEFERGRDRQRTRIERIDPDTLAEPPPLEEGEEAAEDEDTVEVEVPEPPPEDEDDGEVDVPAPPPDDEDDGEVLGDPVGDGR